jgi:hypothetical protein
MRSLRSSIVVARLKVNFLKVTKQSLNWCGIALGSADVSSFVAENASSFILLESLSFDGVDGAFSQKGWLC